MRDLDDLPELPCPEVLIAATMASVTTWAVPAAKPGPSPCRHRTQLAREIVANLFLLQRHPAVSSQLAQVLGNLHQRWVDMARGALQQQGVDFPVGKCQAGTLH